MLTVCVTAVPTSDSGDERELCCHNNTGTVATCGLVLLIADSPTGAPGTRARHTLTLLAVKLS